MLVPKNGMLSLKLCKNLPQSQSLNFNFIIGSRLGQIESLLEWTEMLIHKFRGYYAIMKGYWYSRVGWEFGALTRTS